MILVWAALAVLLVGLSVTLGGEVRLTLLKGVLLLTAVGEGLAFFAS
jgi:hypothetical protein